MEWNSCTDIPFKMEFIKQESIDPLSTEHIYDDPLHSIRMEEISHSNVNTSGLVVSTKLKKKGLKRKIISLNKKIQILDRLKNGDGSTAVANYFNLNEATVRTIKKNEEKIRACVSAGSSLSSKHTCCVRDTIMETMEKTLMIWIEDNIQKRIPVNGNKIRQKAVKIFNYIKSNQQSSSNQISEFSGSKGWFERFKKRNSLHNVKLKGEISSPDEKAAKLFSQEFIKIIAKGSYTPDQVFNVDDTSLFWKKMPNRTEKIGLKGSSDRVTLLFCTNASGDYMMKPLMINRALNPKAMKDLNKTNLPVYWNANKKAWVTEKIFKDWFHQCFIPDAETYLKKKNLAFKILLLINNAPGHPTDLYHKNVKVIFLPPNTASLIQPLDRGIITTLKAYYVKYVFQKIIDELNCNKSLNITQIWKKFTILDCVKLIAFVVRDIKSSIINACWKAIWPEAVLKDNKVPPIENEYSQITDLARQVGGEGFHDLLSTEIVELVMDREFNEDELIANFISSDTESDNDDSPDLTLSVDAIRTGLEMAKNLENHFLNIDPNMERSLKFGRELQNCLGQYKEIYKELSKNYK